MTPFDLDAWGGQAQCPAACAHHEPRDLRRLDLDRFAGARDRSAMTA